MARPLARARRVGAGLARRVAASLGGGASAFVLSELVFLNEGPIAQLTAWDGDVASMIVQFVLFYAVFAYVTLVALWSFGVRGWQSLVLAGALMGWLIEGVIIPLVYEAPPISFLWPSLGWHMIFSFGVAWVGIPYVMRRFDGWAQITVYSVAGVAWALWGRVFFAEDPLMVLPDPASFAGLAAVAGGILIMGRWLSDRPWAWFAPNRWDVVGAAFLALPMGVAMGVAAGPVALGLFAMVAATLWAMARHGRGAKRLAPQPPAPVSAYLRLGTFPLAAAIALPFVPPMPPGWSFVVVLPLTLVATLAWVAAVLGAIRYRRAEPE